MMSLLAGSFMLLLYFTVGAATAAIMVSSAIYAFIDVTLWWPLIWLKIILESFIRVIKSFRKGW